MPLILQSCSNNNGILNAMLEAQGWTQHRVLRATPTFNYRFFRKLPGHR